MRIPASKVYRAFPEFDRFSEEQCERFMDAARRRRIDRACRVGAQAFWTLVALATGFGGYALLISLTGLDPRRVGPTSGADAVFTVALVLELLLGGFAWLMAKDRLLRRRIRRVINTRGSCAACGYVMAGLPVGSDGHVTCPECGYRLEADRSLGEVVPDESGALRFLPSPEVIPALVRWLTPRRRRVIKRLAIGVPLAAGAAVLVAWGGYELFLHRQAVRARALRTGPAGLRALFDDGAASRSESTNAWAMLRDIARGVAEVDIKVTREGTVSYPAYVAPAYCFESIYHAPGNEDSPGAGITREQSRALALALLDAYGAAGLFEAFDRMAGCADVYRDIPDPGPAAPLIQNRMNDISSIWPLMSVNAARMHLAMEKGDPREFERALEASLAMLRMLKAGPGLWERQGAWSLMYSVQARVRGCLARHADRPWIEAMQGPLDRQQSVVPITSAIRGEEFLVQDTVAWVFADPARARGERYSPELKRFFGRWGVRPESRLGTLDENRAAVGAIFGRMAASAAPASDGGEPPGGPAASDLFLVQTFASRSMPAAGFADQEMVVERGMRVLLALERYRLDHGHYPARLADLCPPLAPETVMDPWSGVPLVYRRAGDGPGGVTTYLLYSVGADGQDHGGARPPNEFTALWPGGAGFDFVIWPAEPEQGAP